MEPQTKDRKKFDIDLSYGKYVNKMVADMLQDKKIEVKSERASMSGCIRATLPLSTSPMASPAASMLQSLITGSTTCDIGDEVFATLVFDTIIQAHHRQTRLQEECVGR